MTMVRNMKGKEGEGAERLDGLMARLETGRVPVLGGVSYHGRLLKSEALSRKIVRMLEGSVLPIAAAYPPLVVREGEDFLLVGRYWSFWNAMREGHSEMLVVIATPDDLEVMLEYDKQEMQRLGASPLPAGNRSTRRRKVLREAGMVCPFCGSPVRRYLDKSAELAQQEGHYVHCERNVIKPGSKNHGRLCHFRIKLTPLEYRRFTSGQLRIDALMSPLEGKCSGGKALYERTLHWQDRIEKAERCRDYFSSFPACECRHYRLIERKTVSGPAAPGGEDTP